MSDITVTAADKFSAADRGQALTQAYADYYVPMYVSAEQMARIERFYDIDLSRSWVMTHGEQIIGLALLSIRGEAGWVSGVGVLPNYRRRGLARELLGRLIEAARAGGVRELWLEVIVQNTPARQLYATAGFTEERELLSWRRSADAAPLPIPEERLAAANPADLLRDFDRWHTQRPAWQRSAASLRWLAEAGRLKGYQLECRGAPAAYCLVSGHGDAVSLQDVGIDPGSGVIGPGRTALQALSHRYYGQAMSISNVPADDPLCRVLAALRFLVTMRQIEMRLALT